MISRKAKAITLQHTTLACIPPHRTSHVQKISGELMFLNVQECVHENNVNSKLGDDLIRKNCVRKKCVQENNVTSKFKMIKYGKTVYEKKKIVYGREYVRNDYVRKI